MNISGAGGSYRTTRHPYKMTITDESVSRSDLTDESLFLSLANYEKIQNCIKTDFLIDIIGEEFMN
ncbi:unnamed protein product [Brassica oleracea]